MSEQPSVYPVCLRTPRIELRELRLTDAAAAFRWASDPAFFRYMALDPVESESVEVDFLRDVEATARATPRLDYRLGVVERDADDLVGIVRLTVREPKHRGADIGYGLRADKWGVGLMTDAARLLVDFGFAQLGLHRIWAVCDPRNVGSRRVMEKIGMRHEGRLRADVLAHGEWRDSLVFAVLEDEWRA